MIPLEDARRRVLADCRRLKPSAVPLLDALGCVTAEAVVAADDVPPFANTAMDGYAVRSSDLVAVPARLEVVGTLPAGLAPGPEHEVGLGQAVRIMTGAPLPPGADGVVMVERTRAEDDGRTVVVEAAVERGQHVRLAGSDIAAGQVVFEGGAVLTPGHLGVLASLGQETVRVVPRPRVGVLSTGDELVSGPGALRPGQIRDSNRPMLLALARQSGFDAVDLGVVGDDEDALSLAVSAAVEHCDALVTTGGVSVGDYDYVKTVLDRLGRMNWWQVAIKPAKPFAFGVVGDVPVFGLPGNPVSSLVSFELFARPALRQMAGHREIDRPVVPATADEPLRRQPDGKLHFVRVVATLDRGEWRVRSSGGQASHLLRAMALANALALLPDGHGVDAGETVDAMLLSDG